MKILTSLIIIIVPYIYSAHSAGEPAFDAKAYAVPPPAMLALAGTVRAKNSELLSVSKEPLTVAVKEEKKEPPRTLEGVRLELVYEPKLEGLAAAWDRLDCDNYKQPNGLVADVYSFKIFEKDGSRMDAIVSNLYPTWGYTSRTLNDGIWVVGFQLKVPIGKKRLCK